MCLVVQIHGSIIPLHPPCYVMETVLHAVMCCDVLRCNALSYPVSVVIQDVLELVSSHIQVCEQELAKVKAAAPRIVTTQQRLLDILLLLGTASWVYYAMGMGAGQPLAVSVGDVVLQLPLGYGGVEKAVAVMLLLAAIQRFVFVKVH
jgi:hypothetical protein